MSMSMTNGTAPVPMVAITLKPMMTNTSIMHILWKCDLAPALHPTTNATLKMLDAIRELVKCVQLGVALLIEELYTLDPKINANRVAL